MSKNNFQPFEIFGETVVFTDTPDEYKTNGLYRYDLRHGDDNSYPLTLEHSVTVNYFGTVFSSKPLLDEG